MCRGFQRSERDRLRIRTFTASLSGKDANLFPDALTLHYLPRINGSLIELNGSDIRPDSPAFVTLHRLCADETTIEGGGGAAVYASRERVSVLEGAMFEIYVWDVKALRGIFRRHEHGERWRMECKAAEDGGVEGVREAVVVVEAEGEAAAMREKVVMEARRRRRSACCKLVEIPEEREEGERGSDACRCSECSGQEGMDGRDCGIEDLEMETVGWAVDVGIWVVCLGVGYLVSRASSRKLRKTFF